MTDYRVKIYKRDARYKKGERLENTSEYRSQTEASLQENLDYLKNSFPKEQGYRIQHYPSKIVVRNLMSGNLAEIDADTPWSCRPDSETYWSI
jgi:hypothetical protein